METASGYALNSSSIAYVESANDWYRNGRFGAVELHHVELDMGDREENRGERSIWNTPTRRGREEAEERRVAAFMVSVSRGEEEDPAKRDERIACEISLAVSKSMGLFEFSTNINPRKSTPPSAHATASCFERITQILTRGGVVFQCVSCRRQAEGAGG
jgi:hypothetical protein